MSVALITGASRGLGLALARDLAAAGWKLVIDARGETALTLAAGEIGPGVTAIPGDVADPIHREALARAVEAEGTLDLLVNNASTLGPSPLPALERFPSDELEQVFRVNAVAPLALTQLVLPRLAESNGAVVNITSDAGVEAYQGWGGYGASKAALEQLGAVLSVEQPSIRVYTFDPGDMRTQMQQDAFPGEDISDRPDPDTVVPALIRLINERPASGRYRAVDLFANLGASV